MKISNLNELFVHELKDLYDAEHQLVEALPKLARAATNPELAEAFQKHLDQTRTHIDRLETVFATCGQEPERITCRGMKGLIDEAERLLKEDLEPEVVDAGLIGAAQRIEHYEIAAYGTLRVWALTAGFRDAQELLEVILGEEKAANDKLTEIAESGVNVEAEGGGASEAEEATTTPRKRSTPGVRSKKPTRTRRAEPAGSKSRR